MKDAHYYFLIAAIFASPRLPAHWGLPCTAIYGVLGLLISIGVI